MSFCPSVRLKLLKTPNLAERFPLALVIEIPISGRKVEGHGHTHPLNFRIGDALLPTTKSAVENLTSSVYVILNHANRTGQRLQTHTLRFIVTKNGHEQIKIFHRHSEP